ncbi:MAG: DNA-directed RNA polymerase subunit beta [Gemmatimonadetes bacterium]|nr:MAG: DNA-directed RNA polymerase subunit beta [Gemmatimonadota bacterium]
MSVVRKRPRRDFSRLKSAIDMPNLLAIQMESFEHFLQGQTHPDERRDEGLQGVFTSIFPISDPNENFTLEFVRYTLGEPKYTVQECQERDVTYAVPLKVTLRLVIRETDKSEKRVKDVIEQNVYLGELPIITDKGTFIINGAERVIVSQLHRSPGVFFDEEMHPKGKRLFSSRIIPYRGSWVQFSMDINDVMYVHIDKRRKIPVTVLLRALGYATDEVLLDILCSETIPLHQISKTGTVRIEGRRTEKLFGRIITENIINPETDEVIAEKGTLFDADHLEKIREANVKAIKLRLSDQSPAIGMVENTLKKEGDDFKSEEKALERIYNLLRPGDLPNIETARQLLERLFFNPKRYDLAKVGRYKLNRRLGLDNVESAHNIKKKGKVSETLSVEGEIRNIEGNPVQNAQVSITFTRRDASGTAQFGPITTYTNAEGYYEFETLPQGDYAITVSCEGYINTSLTVENVEQPLEINFRLDQTILSRRDFVEIVKYMLLLRSGKGFVDDIDHLGNRRIRSVGELLANQFSIGLSRMARIIREGMTLHDADNITPYDLINVRTVTSVIQSFFGSSQLSQFMDQTNPLAELTHKRRLSALGPGGLTRERASFDVRDVHYTHYGRMCPIETPEGQNIGLITSMSTYARINEHGFLETPYRKVVDGQVLSEIEYLSADKEDYYVIAGANTKVDENGMFVESEVIARHRGDFNFYSPDEIHYMDVSPKQLVSAAAALIPFLEHDDANRALMGSNMQRQAVPLMTPQSPVVGTGMEQKVAIDSKAAVASDVDGVVEYVSSDTIHIRPDEQEAPRKVRWLDMEPSLKTYRLTKFRRSNQDTCINQRPIVKVGQRVKKGQPLADGPATQFGELALGSNALVAFMPWRGYNFEDAIVVSERVVSGDKFTSIHIEEFDLEVRDTKRGMEEITREIPNVSDDALRNLDEDGIIRVGAHVKAGDILVGKITPKGETELTPEENLLRAIFGERAGDVRDASLKAPPGMDGIVIDVKVFSRRERHDRAIRTEKKKIEEIKSIYRHKLGAVLEQRDNLLHQMSSLYPLANSSTWQKIENAISEKGQKLTQKLIDGLEFERLREQIQLGGVFDLDLETRRELNELLMNVNRAISEIQSQYEKEVDKITRGDELAPGVLKLVKVYIARKQKLSVGDKMAGRHGNKGVVSKIVPVEDMPYLEDGRPVDVLLNPLGVPSRMNVGQILETHLGWAGERLGVNFATNVFDGASIDQIQDLLEEAGLPRDGKMRLFDGRTGEPFDLKVTVGVMYMMKLDHLVDDKIHARSIGPYSLVTQQPLGGKAQFGGQRFGEMEVWALEAYGAAYTLQELLTVKSDDVYGRSRIYEAIVKGDNPPEPGIPESFNVLVKELQSLALDVELITDDEEE